MSSSYFYTDIQKDELTKDIIDYFEKYAQNRNTQVYLINKPLGENKYSYSQSKVMVLLIPKSKITFINIGESSEAFENFYEDFTEDIGIISDKYDYKKILGRPKEWKFQSTHKVQKVNFDFEQLLLDIQIPDPKWQKNCDLLISLITGSINEVDRVRDDVPQTILDKIKQKIVLFDGDQTRFIYSKPQQDQKMITIQGLSGTGKTELLLQKLKELYIEDNQTKLLFTCWNKVLSESLRDRIPQFFNFMKVDQQIEWNTRLFCFHAWGSTNDIFSGAYRYICHFYNIPFNKYSRLTTFATFCTTATESIQSFKEMYPNNFQYVFDYSFIDESQDFPQSFFELINLVTKSTVYIAGDIFQDIFSRDNEITSNPNYLLSKCYRTDPRTLMFAHALGMGLLEEKKLRWLTDTQWNACGYQFSKDSGNYLLKREPLRRFEDLDAQKFECVKLLFNENITSDNTISLILEQIDIIIKQNETVRPEDIAIIFIDKDNSIFYIADRLVAYIENKYGWEVNRAYESKQVLPNTILLSNSNNAKGLEFPFVICIIDTIGYSYNLRNTLYTMLTRSFIQSVLIVTQKINDNLKNKLYAGLKSIYDNGFILVKEPSDTEKEDIKTNLEAHSKSQISLQELFFGVCDRLKIPKVNAHKLLDAYVLIYRDNEIDEKNISDWIIFNSKPMKKP